MRYLPPGAQEKQANWAREQTKSAAVGISAIKRDASSRKAKEKETVGMKKQRKALKRNVDNEITLVFYICYVDITCFIHIYT